MKKIYLCAMALSVGSLSFGQQLVGKQFTENMSQLSKDNGQAINTTSSNNKAPGDIIWSEDFTGGFPSGWSVLDNTGNSFDWVLDPGTANVVADFTNTAPIASNSGGNYMLINADGYNSPVPAGGAIEMDAYFQTSAIALTGQPGISVEFQQKFRRCCANAGIEVNLVASMDPTFATGVGTYDINGGVQTNSQSPDPMNMSINITDIAGGQTGMLYLRWHLSAGSSHYYWMIDDINVVESPVNDLVTTKGYYGFFGVELTRIPASQRQPMDVSMIYNNIGSADQTGTQLTVDVNDGTTSVHNASSTAFTANSLTSDTLSIDSTWTPPASPLNTQYTVTLSINSDSTDSSPANNGVIFPPFQVTTGEMAMDDYSTTPGNGGGNSGPNGVTEYEAGNQFDIVNQNEDLYAIDLVTGPNTPVGTFIDVVIYQIDFTATPESYTVIWRSPSYTTTAADLGVVHSFRGVIPTNPIATLIAGETYFVAVHSFIDYEYGVSGTNPSAGTPSARHSAIRYPSMGSPNAGSSFGLSNVPMIRLNFNIFTGIDVSNENIAFNVYPNPSNGLFNINLSSDEANTVQLSVKNLVGQTIINETVSVSGKTNHSISLANYSKGVYFLTVGNETVKLIVE